MYASGYKMVFTVDALATYAINLMAASPSTKHIVLLSDCRVAGKLSYSNRHWYNLRKFSMNYNKSRFPKRKDLTGLKDL